MRGSGKLLIGLIGPIAVSLWFVACSSVQDQQTTSAPAPAQQAPQAKAPAAPAKTAETKAEAPRKEESAKASAKTKAVEVEGVISGVGQRTITFQVDRKGKIREEVVGVDEKTKIE